LVAGVVAGTVVVTFVAIFGVIFVAVFVVVFVAVFVVFTKIFGVWDLFKSFMYICLLICRLMLPPDENDADIMPLKSAGCFNSEVTSIALSEFAGIVPFVMFVSIMSTEPSYFGNMTVKLTGAFPVFTNVQRFTIG
jgi:hypothetical protein